MCSPHDPGKAAGLLDQSGWLVDESAGGLRFREGREFRFTLTIWEGSLEFQCVARYLQRDLRRLGIVMDLDIVGLTEFRHRRKSGDLTPSPVPLSPAHIPIRIATGG